MDKNVLSEKSEKWLEREGREIISVNLDKAVGSGGKENATLIRWSKNHRPSKYIQHLKEKNLRRANSYKDNFSTGNATNRKPIRLPPLVPRKTNTGTKKRNKNMDEDDQSRLPGTRTKLPPIQALVTQQQRNSKREAKDRDRFLTKTLSSSDIKTAEFPTSQNPKPGVEQKKKSKAARRNVDVSSSDQTVCDKKSKTPFQGKVQKQQPFVVGRYRPNMNNTDNTLNISAEIESQNNSNKAHNNKPAEFSAPSNATRDFLSFNLNSTEASKSGATKNPTEPELENSCKRTKQTGAKRVKSAESNIPESSNKSRQSDANPRFPPDIQLCNSNQERSRLSSGKCQDKAEYKKRQLSACNARIAGNRYEMKMETAKDEETDVEADMKESELGGATDGSGVYQDNLNSTIESLPVGPKNPVPCKTGLMNSINPTEDEQKDSETDVSSDLIGTIYLVNDSKVSLVSTKTEPELRGEEVPHCSGFSPKTLSPITDFVNVPELEFLDSTLNAADIGQRGVSYCQDRNGTFMKPVSSEGGSVEILRFYRDNFSLLLRNIKSTESFPCMPKRCKTPKVFLKRSHRAKPRKTLAQLEARLTKDNLSSGMVGIEILQKRHNSRDFKRRLSSKKL